MSADPGDVGRATDIGNDDRVLQCQAIARWNTAGVDKGDRQVVRHRVGFEHKVTGIDSAGEFDVGKSAVEIDSGRTHAATENDLVYNRVLAPLGVADV